LVAIAPLACLFLVVAGATASPIVVYDNTSTFTRGSGPAPDGFWYAPNGFWPFNSFAANEPMGDQIKLAGTERTVTEFDLILSSVKPVVLPSLTLTLYDVNPDTLTLGNQLWATSLSNLTVDGNTIVPITVPNVQVPDELIWLAGADSIDAGLATCNPPTVGQGPDYTGYNFYWDVPDPNTPYTLDFWGNPVANFGARVFAVPEPTVVALLAMGGLLRAARKPRQTRRR
jgi:hypothetical protein